jgi:hypothetical protein
MALQRLNAVRTATPGLRPIGIAAAAVPPVEPPDETAAANQIDDAVPDALIAAAAKAPTAVKAAIPVKAATAVKAATPVKAATAVKASVAKATPTPAVPKAVRVLGGTRAKMEVDLPASTGSRIQQDAVHELFFQYCAAHAEELGFLVPTKAMAVRILDLPFQFLLGDLEAKEIGSGIADIVKDGGLARLFEVKLGAGVHFKHKLVDEATYRNPRNDSPPGQHIMVRGRRFVFMKTLVDAGSTQRGYMSETDGGGKPVFVPEAGSEGPGADVFQTVEEEDQAA